MDRKTLLTTLLIGGGTDAGTAIAQLQHAVSVLDETKADKTGTVALANNLTPYSADSGATQSVPFINQGTGSGNGESVVDTGSYAQIKKKLGNTVAVNQLANITPSTGTNNGVTYTIESDGTVTLSGIASANSFTNFLDTSRSDLLDHYVYIAGCPSGGSTNTYFLRDGYTSMPVDIGQGVIIKAKANFILQIQVKSGVNTEGLVFHPIFRDLTLWFGSNDRIPSHLLSHPEDFGRYYSGSLAYNPGQLVNSDGSVLTSIGRNIFDKTQTLTESYYLGSENAPHADSSWDYTDYIEIIPNTDYYASVTGSNPSTCFYDKDKNFISGLKNYTITANNKVFTTPANAKYLRTSIEKTKVDIFVISLYYPGESGYDQYYPYTVLAEVDTGSEVLRSAGAVADEKTPDGTITRRIGVIDMGTLSFETVSANGKTYSNIISDIRKGSASGYGNFIQSAIFIGVEKASMELLVDGEMSVDTGGRLQICKTAWANYTSAQIATALSGVYLYYELATPTTEQGTPFSGASADNFAIDDFGSMYWTQSAGVPQGVEIFYPYDYKAAVDTLLNMVDGDVEKLVTETELGAVADRIPEAPAEDGTYTLKATVADGVKTYAWVADA